MSPEKTDNTGCCTDSSCGCRIDIYPVSAKCPECGQRLRLIGRAELAEFRPNCPHCGYTGSLSSQEELGELL
jgi:hypothetical protein